MAHKYWWEVEDHILYVRYWGDLTLAELTQSIDELVQALVGSGQPLVHLINDVSEVQKPVSVVDVAKMARQYQQPEQMGWLITVGEKNPLIRFSNSIAGQILGQRMRSFDTREEALAFLKSADASIDWAKARKA